MGRIKYLSTTEWLKYVGQLELADFFSFYSVSLLVFARCSVKLKVFSSLNVIFLRKKEYNRKVRYSMSEP